MAIGTYSQLKTALETWLSRQGDTTISGNAADFVTLGEARLNRDLPLRVMHTTTALTGTSGSRSVTLPTDFLEPKALFLTTFSVQTMLTPLVAGNFEYDTVNGTPTGWCINGENIDLDRPCDRAHTFSFRYRKSFTLSDASPTNWLLTNHPDCYLSACMVEVLLMAQDLEMMAVWDQRLQTAIASLSYVDSRSIAVAPLTIDPALAGQSAFNINTGA